MNKFINLYVIFFTKMIEKKITLIKVRKKPNMSVNEELMWFGQSLGLFQKRDKDKSCYRIFVELLKKQGLSSEELSYKLNLSRATIVHHLKKLMKAGLVIEESKRYYLRVETLKQLIEELENDLKIIIKDLEKSAERIDKALKH